MFKSNLKIHLIFVVKYRKNIIKNFEEDIKKSFLKSSKDRDFEILLMEADLNHIHLLIEFKPKVSITQIARCLKKESVFNLWKDHSYTLIKYFWKEKTFWSDGYFVSTVGEASEETIRKYIENQG